MPVVHVQVDKAAIRYNSWTTNTPGPAGTYGAFEIISFTGTCASGLSRDVATLGRLNWDLSGFRYETRGDNGWDTSNYDNTTNGGAPENGKVFNHHFINSEPGGTYAYSKLDAKKGDKMQLTSYTRCRNKTTNYLTDVSGRTFLPPLYDYGVIYGRSGTNAYGYFNIACNTSLYSGISYYCAAGYNSSGTLKSSALTSCAVRAYGSLTDDRYWSNQYSATSSTPPCWSTNYAITE